MIGESANIYIMIEYSCRCKLRACTATTAPAAFQAAGFSFANHLTLKLFINKLIPT